MTSGSGLNALKTELVDEELSSELNGSNFDPSLLSKMESKEIQVTGFGKREV